MDIFEEKTVDNITVNSVSILTQEFTVIDGIKTQVGENYRCAYSNSVSDRERLIATEPDEVVAIVLSVWGDSPTVEEQIPMYIPTKEELLEKRLEALEAQNEALTAQNALLESCILEMSEIVYAE